MARKVAEPTTLPRERAFLVGVDIFNEKNLLTLDESLTELALLADTAGLEVVGKVKQHLDQPNPSTFVGSGKLEEIKVLVEDSLAEVVIFDNELSPRHQRELELKLGEAVKVIDRTALILDIFAQHAHTREGILQVELAQYEYRLPRLTRAWTHLARQTGGAAGRTGSVGGVGLRGPGETQLEVDRREIRRRITHLKKELDAVRAHRMRYRVQRKRSHIPIVALVGYTNAGKSTLMNRLAKCDVFVADQLFATLDPTTRRVDLPGNHWALFTDTVGFIQKLPTQLIAAFRATLEEIAEADLLIHVVDITHQNALAQAKAVQATLAEIDADQIPVVTALNKIDLLQDPQRARQTLEHFGNSAAVSAKTGEGMEDLLQAIETELFETFVTVSVKLPYQQGQLISLFHEQGQVEKVENERGGVSIRGNLPVRLLARFQPYMIKPINTELSR
jgi:GTP-binding protein HflX